MIEKVYVVGWLYATYEEGVTVTFSITEVGVNTFVNEDVSIR